jgi:type VII secretion protein EccB
MASRQDQLHSYQFMMQRVVAAMIMRETDPARAPLRRGVGAAFGGFMLAIVVAATFGVYGIFTGIGSQHWRADGAVVVEKETGATYVYRSGVLHPMINYTSALLASGDSTPTTFRVNAAELKGTPRSVPAGIPGAPNSLPGADAAVGAPWSLCSVPGRDETGRQTTVSTLLVGRSPAGGKDIGDAALLVRQDPDGGTYLVWHGYRYPVEGPDTVVPALFGAQVAATPVDTAWLNGLPAGTGLGPIEVPGAGAESGAVPGHRVGDLLSATTGSGVQYYLVFDDGLAPITAVQKDIVVGGSSVKPQQIALSAATAAPRSSRLPAASGAAEDPPATVPKLATVGAAAPVCAVFRGAAATPVVRAGGAVATGEAIQTSTVTSAGTRLVDRVLVPPGQVAIARSVPAGGSGAGSYDVITDTGQRFPVPSTDALAALGYPASLAVRVPAGLVTAIPYGPTLDPADALKPATGD